MKRILFSLMAMLVVCVLAAPAHAFLINRGTDTLGNRMIYDQDLDITWYDYSKIANQWQNQVNWASGLSVTFGSTTFNDWRLPTTVDGTPVTATNPSFYNGTGPSGYNITTSELGHLFYTELGNLGMYDTSGNLRPGVAGVDWGLANTGDFQNLVLASYWSGTEYSANTDRAWNFSFGRGRQLLAPKYFSRYALAVRSGDVAASTAVPEPATIALLGIGLAGMGVYG